MPQKKGFSRRLDMPIDEIRRICQVTRATALRWEREGFPYQAERLCALTRDGRIMPDKWTHSRFNHRGNLELHSGEAREADILNLPYMRVLMDGLKRDARLMRVEIQRLREEVNRLEQTSDTRAANQPYFEP